MIEIKNLQKAFDDNIDNPIIKCIDVTINDGDIISVIGGSGCGKSTFIRCINMLGKPTGGQIVLDGEDISAPGYDLSKISRKIGMVFQSFNLFNHLTVIENIMLPQIETLKVSKQQAYDKAMSLLHKVNLSSKALSYPDSLSGGQKQRVAIARTLAMDPEVILFDEPTSALDPTMVGEVKAVIHSLTKTGKTMMIVTHDMEFARSISNRVFYIDEGTIYEQGTPDEIFNNPQKEKTKQFINELKVLDINIDSKDYDFYGASTLIDSYCKKNQISYTKAYHLQSIFDELCIEILTPILDEPLISFHVEYTKNYDILKAIVKYGNKSFDIEDSENKLSLSLIKGFARSIEYARIDEEFVNQLVIDIK